MTWLEEFDLERRQSGDASEIVSWTSTEGHKGVGEPTAPWWTSYLGDGKQVGVRIWTSNRVYFSMMTENYGYDRYTIESVPLRNEPVIEEFEILS